MASQLKALAILPEDQSSDVGWGSLLSLTVTPVQGTQHTLLTPTGSIHTCSHEHTQTHTHRDKETDTYTKTQKETETDRETLFLEYQFSNVT